MRYSKQLFSLFIFFVTLFPVQGLSEIATDDPGFTLSGKVFNKKTKKVFASTNLYIIVGSRLWIVKTGEAGEYVVIFLVGSEQVPVSDPQNARRIYFRIPLHDGEYRETSVNLSKLKSLAQKSSDHASVTFDIEI